MLAFNKKNLFAYLCLAIAVPLAIKAFKMIDKEESAIAERV